MRRTLASLLLFGTLACPSRPQPPVAPDPPERHRVLTRLGNAFLLTQDTYLPSDTFQYVVDDNTCAPRLAYVLWRRQGDTLTGLSVAYKDSVTRVFDIHEPLDLEQGIQDTYNMLTLRTPSEERERLFDDVQLACERHEGRGPPTS